MSDAPPVPFPTSSGSACDPAPTTRRAAFYRENSFQPFSRSAAKRQSIMALGSIKHLQHQYIKFGLGSANVGPASAKPSLDGAGMMEEPEELDEEPEANKNRRKGRRPLLRVSLGRVQGLRGEDAAELPPSPAKPEVDRRMPWEKNGEKGRSVKDEKELRRDVLVTLEDVCERWGLVTNLSYHPLRRRSSRSSYSEYDQQQQITSRSPEPLLRPVSSLSAASDEDARPPSLVLELLQTTTAAVRNVQLYVVSLPTDAFAPRANASASTTPTPAPETASLSVSPNSPSTPPRVSSPFTPPDAAPAEANPLHQLRQSSLAVLGALKTLEQRYRLPLADAPISPASDSAPPSSSSSESTPHADGFEYNAATLDDMADEARTVREYVEVVDRVLFRDRERRRGSIRVGEDSDGRKLGHRRSKKVEKKEDVILPVETSVGDKVDDLSAEKVGVPSVVEPERDEDDLSESGSEDDLPEWALLGPGTARTHSILAAHLPPTLAPRLAEPASRLAFLESLSDGTLLCNAYNGALRASAKPFGFVPEKNIHDLVVESHEGDNTKERVGATFRRVENLRVWSAALKFRYLISFDPPKQKGLPSTPPPTATQGFDPRMIGRKEAGWEDVLERAVERWVSAVVEEKLL